MVQPHEHSGQPRRMVRTLLAGLIELVYPSICWVCGKLTASHVPLICAECRRALTYDPHPACPRCSSTVGPYAQVAQGCPACRKETFAFDGAFRMGPYEGPLRDTILRMKQSAGEDLAEVIGAVWAKEMAPRLRATRIDVVVPVPLHWLRRWRRGFNQCAVLGERLARELGVEFRPDALRCAHRISEQKLLSATARRENVRDAFRARGSLAGRKVLLVDDVLTTGATAHEAARALRGAGAAQIWVAVLGR